MFQIGDKIITSKEIHHSSDTRIPRNTIGILSHIVNAREVVVDFPFNDCVEVQCDVSNVALLWTP